MTQSSMDELVAMGYSEGQATKALQVAGGDVAQAVGFLLMGEKSRKGFDHSLTGSINFDASTDTAALSLARTLSPPIAEVSPIPCSPVTQEPVSATGEQTSKKICELMQMGYSRSHARHALTVAQGDLAQAVNFLLMGESKTGFVVNVDEIMESTTNGLAIPMSIPDIMENDEAMAVMLQQQELSAMKPTGTTTTNIANAASTTITGRPITEIPKMVATESYLETEAAEPFCACVAASKFLQGGVVTSSFLNEILGTANELVRKISTKADNETRWSIEQVLHRYGKSHLNLKLMPGEPKRGMFMLGDLEHLLGVRKQLALCRNQQASGWQLYILELPGFDCFSICLPPKGSKNKFWYLDFRPRAQFMVPGAYARVHSTMQQLAESLESVFRTMVEGQTKKYEPFVLYPICQEKSRRFY